MVAPGDARYVAIQEDPAAVFFNSIRKATPQRPRPEGRIAKAVDKARRLSDAEERAGHRRDKGDAVDTLSRP